MPRVKKKSYRKLTEERKLKQKEKCDLKLDNDSKVSKDFKILTPQDIKERMKINQKKRLQKPIQLNVHRARLRETQRKRLQNHKQREIHRSRLRVTQRKRLQDTEKREAHRTRLKISEAKRLQDPEKKKANRIRLQISQKKRLQDPKQREAHRTKLKISRQKRLQDTKQREAHRTKLKINQQKRLQDTKQREAHRTKLKINQQKRLQDRKQREAHRTRLKISQQKRLHDPKQREAHRTRLKLNQHKRFEDLEKLKMHRIRLRENQKKNKKSHSLAVRKSFLIKREREKDFLRKRQYESFIFLKKEGPTFECVCCSRLFFPGSVRYYQTSNFTCKADFLRKACTKMKNNAGYMCSTCKKSLSIRKIPTLSLCNDQLKFPRVHEAIAKLSDLEERFVAPRIPFMQIRALFNEQFMQKGRAVNVPCEIEDNVSVLPRARTETKLVPIAFRRKKRFKSNLMVENVRPKVIEEAVKLLENSPLYKYCGIKVDTSNLMKTPTISDTNSNLIRYEENEDDLEEEDYEKEPLNVPDEETLLISAIVFAPAEGRKPVSLFDKYAEAMSFIKIYGGELVTKPDGLSYQNWIKSELIRSDRRCATISKLFFSASKLRISKVASSIGFCLRKSKSAISIQASELLKSNFIEKLETHDSGFKMFETDRGSPAFWEKKKKQVFAAIRQLGNPTLFLTLSPAETKWPELLVILKSVIDREEITEETAKQMEYSEKVRLIRSDPVTVARYIEHRMNQIFKLLRQRNSIFREHYVVDFYTRCEFQKRGSPHWHSLLWLHNAPQYEAGEDNANVISFIDNFISADLNPDDELIDLQMHKHTFTCRKGKNKGRCRFDIPFFPLERTMILLPLNEISKEDLKDLRKKRDDIQTLLTELVKKNCETLTQEDFLRRCNLDLNNYIKCIRSGLKRPTVMVKRKVDQCMVNVFNSELLELHRGNMDIQFILDVYSCANYVVNYLNKSNRGLSILLRDALSEVRKGNYSIKEKMRLLGNTFLNASEFTAQEAVFYTLPLPLSKFSRKCVFINTSAPEKRILVIKPKKELECLPPESVDVYQKTVINHYSQRPDSLENACLAYFTAWYNYSKNSRRITSSDETDSYSTTKEEKSLRLKDDSGYLFKRSKAKIIRYVRYNRHTHSEDFIREQVMLFIPWRIEDHMISNAEHLYNKYNNELQRNRSEFIKDIEDILDSAVKQEIAYQENSPRSISIRTAENLAVLGGFKDTPDIMYDFKDLASSHAQAKIDNEIVFPIPNMKNEEEYYDMLVNLNQKQREYLLHVLHAFKCSKLPIFDCVLGGAGVGKSRLIEALHQTILRFSKNTDTNLETIKVLLCAPTGKAAYGIRGITLHAAFALPFNQTSAEAFTPLSTGTVNSMRSKLIDLKLVIIDEISMVGSRMLQFVNFRLQQIFKSSESFAGKSIIVLGDFNQLPPVGDSLVFEPSRTDEYGEIIGINPLWMKFQCFQLTEIMRQKDDHAFATALMNLSKGTLTPNDLSLFKSRVCKPEDVPNNAVRLFATNNAVELYNTKVINEDKNKIEVKAIDKISGNIEERHKIKLLEKIENLPSRETQGLPTFLGLSKGKKYMITNNLNIEDGLVNGAIGTLEEYTILANNHFRLWIQFPEENVGKIRRREVEHPTWTAIDMIKREIRLRKNQPITIVRQQFPLIPAEAITIHKSQGATYKAVAVHLHGLRRNSLYVALSRCTSLSGLFLLGTFKEPVAPSPFDKVKMEIERLRNKDFTTACPFLANYKNHITILYSNVQSLTKFLSKDVWNNIKYNSPTFFIAAETWTTCKDVINIPNYDILSRIDCSQHRHPFGLVVFVRHDVYDKCKLQFYYEKDKGVESCCLIVFVFEDKAICVGYKPPKSTWASVKYNFEMMLTSAFLVKKKVMVIGDFNVDFLKRRNSEFYLLLKKFGLKNCMDEYTFSTDLKTQIDIAFANFDVACAYTESFVSYHKDIIGIFDHSTFPIKTRKKCENKIVTEKKRCIYRWEVDLQSTSR